MDKETLSNYGWIVILVLILSVLLALATPFGNFIAGAIKATTAGFFSVNQGALGAAGIHIPGQDVDDPFAKKGYAVFDKFVTNPGCHTDTWEDYHTEDCYTFEETTLTWDELMLAENGEKYGYDASAVSDTVVGRNTFRYCDTLKSISFPSSIAAIDDQAFENCFALTTVDFKGCTNLTIIGDSAFEDCEILTHLDLTPCTGLTSIGDCAFDACESLVSVDLSGCASLETIIDYAFCDCYSLETIDLSGCTSLTTIGEEVFNFCTSLKTADLSGCTNLTTIGESAFDECPSLTTVNLSGCTNLTTIDACAFIYCESLNAIDLSEHTSLAAIGQQAFSWCSSLTDIILPASVKEMGEGAFNDCTSLTNITFQGTMEQWNAITFGTDWNLNVPATQVQCSDGTVSLF